MIDSSPEVSCRLLWFSTLILTDKVTTYAATLLLAPHRRRIWQGTGRGNGCQGLLKRYGGNNIYITKIRFLLYTCRQRNRMNLIYEERSINLLVEPSRGVDSS